MMDSLSVSRVGAEPPILGVAVERAKRAFNLVTVQGHRQSNENTYLYT